MTSGHAWLMFFYTVPSKPVNNRIKIWRRLAKAGAVQLKNTVYLLPFSEEHYEFFEWLTQEVDAMGGDGTFVQTQNIEPMDDGDLKRLFSKQRENDYRDIDKKLDTLERKVNSVTKGSGTRGSKQIEEQFHRLARDLHAVTRIDFFSSEVGKKMKEKMGAVEGALKRMGRDKKECPSPSITSRRVEEYQGKIWVTRTRPFIDRMASAWLIRKFIDKNAKFTFTEDHDAKKLTPQHVAFDIRGGEFTHQGDLCTFEVLVKTFGLWDKALKKIADIVHELDMKDGKYETPEASGIEEILTGIRKTITEDAQALEKGMSVFEMLYAANA